GGRRPRRGPGPGRRAAPGEVRAARLQRRGPGGVPAHRARPSRAARRARGRPVSRADRGRARPLDGLAAAAGRRRALPRLLLPGLAGAVPARLGARVRAGRGRGRAPPAPADAARARARGPHRPGRGSRRGGPRPGPGTRDGRSPRERARGGADRPRPVRPAPHRSRPSGGGGRRGGRRDHRRLLPPRVNRARSTVESMPSPASSPRPLVPAEAVAEIAALAENAVAEHRTSGVTWAIIGGHAHEQAILAHGAAGHRELSEGTPAPGSSPMDRATVSRIASMTKSFTAATILALRDEGALRLEDPVSAHVPEAADAFELAADDREPTLRRLLTMDAGLVTDNP